MRVRKETRLYYHPLVVRGEFGLGILLKNRGEWEYPEVLVKSISPEEDEVWICAHPNSQFRIAYQVPQNEGQFAVTSGVNGVNVFTGSALNDFHGEQSWILGRDGWHWMLEGWSSHELQRSGEVKEFVFGDTGFYGSVTVTYYYERPWWRLWPGRYPPLPHPQKAAPWLTGGGSRTTAPPPFDPGIHNTAAVAVGSAIKFRPPNTAYVPDKYRPGVRLEVKFAFPDAFGLLNEGG